jgi:hypothetical protein
MASKERKMAELDEKELGVASEWLDIGGSVVEISVFSLNKWISILGSWI